MTEPLTDYPPDLCPCGKKKAECGGYETFCWSCNEHEASPEDVFVVCFECNHVYATAADLERRFEEIGGPKHPAAEILACPECAHDF